MGQIYIIINSKLIDWCKWEQIFTTILAMACFIGKLNVLQLTIILLDVSNLYLGRLLRGQFCNMRGVKITDPV